MEKPRKWRHKDTGQIFNVIPWWQCEGELIDAESAKKALKDDPEAQKEIGDWPDRLYRVGVLAQIGWLLENEHNIWVGLGPKAKNYFDDLGEEG